MKTKNFFGLMTTALLMLSGTQVAQAQSITPSEKFLTPAPKMMGHKAPASAPTVTHDYAWYASKTYTWTNASGQTRTASLTDEVTNPYQMYDMLRWVYCNPEIPGNKYTAVSNSNVYYGEQYDVESYLVFFTRHVEVGWNISDDDVTAPNEDGHTLFLVKLKNYTDDPTFHTSTKADLVDYFSKYVESIQLISDGLRVGSGNDAGTLFNISGTFNRFFILGKGKSVHFDPTTSDLEPPYAPFYNMFEEYSPTTTDPDAEITDFYQKMNEGETYPVVHDCASVISFKHYFSMSGHSSTEEKSLSDMIIFIPDNRNAYQQRDYNPNYQPTTGRYVIQLEADANISATEGYYDVTLDWTSTLNEVAGEVPQTYTVYIVTTDEHGTQSYEYLTTTTSTTYTYQEPQGEHSYTISYIVHGEATQNSAFEAWSNIADVVIPGTNDFLELKLGHYESDYRSAEELNYYRNYLNIANEDELNALTPARVAGGEGSFTLYRFDLTNEDVKTPVANLTLSPQGNNSVSYLVEYENQHPLAGYNVAITTAGMLHTNNMGALVMSPITFVDQFTASTASNDHPQRYGYVLMLNNGDSEKGTNTVEVPVQKTNASIDGFYTLDEVMGDTEPSLPVGVKNANFEMNLVNNPATYYYTIERGDNTNPDVTISKLQRVGDGSFMEMNDYLGLKDTPYEEGPFSLFDTDVLYGEPGDFATYVPVIWTFGTQRVNHDGENSYGSAILKTGVGDINAYVTGTRSTTQFGEWRDENNNLCAIFNPTITVNGIVPVGANVVYEPFMYRVWRLCDGVRGYVINPATNMPVNDPSAPRNAKELIIEEVTSEPSIMIGDEFDLLGYGALVNSQTKFLVRFYYKTTGETFLRAGEEGPLYYVVEKTIGWDEIPTSIAEINAANEVSKTYYNAQGVKSDVPFDGVNIVITRYSDGSTRTTKVIR